MNGGLELHFMKIEAHETETMAMPIARYAFEFSLRATSGHFLNYGLVDRDSFDAPCLPDERDHL